ncbi:MAG: cytochrome c [Deltaproteobacteria bacterium]|nr:cytochrome c [Deltaproteobacteria bacterium]
MKNSRGRWWLCFAALGALIFTGVGTALLGPAAQAQPAPETPAQIFTRACGRCHPNGDEDVGPSIKNKRLTKARITQLIRRGTSNGRMKAITPAKLSNPDLTKMLGFLRTIRAMR